MLAGIPAVGHSGGLFILLRFIDGIFLGGVHRSMSPLAMEYHKEKRGSTGDDHDQLPAGVRGHLPAHP